MAKTKEIRYGRGVVGPDVKVTKYERRVYPLAEGGLAIVNVFMSMYFLFYATVIMGIDPAVAGTMTLFARIFDAVNDPMMGAIVDRTDTRFGTCRPYLMFGSVFIGLSIVLLFAIPQGLSMTGKIVWMWVFYILENMMVTLVGIPYKGMMSRLTNEGSERMFINRNCLIASYLMALFASLAIPAFVGRMTSLFPGNAPGLPYTISCAVLMVFVCGLYILVGITVKERKFVVAALSDTKAKLSDCIKILFRNKYWFLITIAATLNYFITGVNTAITLHYTNYILNAGSILTIITMVANFGIPLIVMLIVPRYAVSKGKRPVAITGILIAASGMLLRLVMGISAPLWVYVAGLFLFNAGMATFTTCQATGMLDCIEYSEWRFGVRNDGMIISAYSMSSKAGPGLATALVGILLKAIKFDKLLIVGDPAMQRGIFNIAVLVPLLFLVLFAVLMCFWDLDKKQPTIRADLDQRRAAVATGGQDVSVQG